MRLNIRLISTAVATVVAIVSIVMSSFSVGPAPDAAVATPAATSWVANAFPIGQASFAQPAAARR